MKSVLLVKFSGVYPMTIDSKDINDFGKVYGELSEDFTLSNSKFDKTEMAKYMELERIDWADELYKDIEN